MIQSETFILAHLSDPHLADHRDARFVDFLNKRFLGYIKWWLRRKSEHHPDVLADLVDDVRASQPDHIVVTGDLTHLGLPAEFMKAKELLRALGTPSQVTIIPGNHDAYVGADWDRNLKHWADYIVSDDAAISDGAPLASTALFPSLRIRGPLALIGVCSARPCSTFLAVGTVGKAQLKRLEKILIETGQKGLCRVILIHHPPMTGLVSWRKRLTDAKAFGSMLQRYGANLILHGHAHHDSQGRLRTPDGYAPVIGISSASSIGHSSRQRARYLLFHLRASSDGWQVGVSARSYLNPTQKFFTEGKYQLTI